MRGFAEIVGVDRLIDVAKSISVEEKQSTIKSNDPVEECSASQLIVGRYESLENLREIPSKEKINALLDDGYRVSGCTSFNDWVGGRILAFDPDFGKSFKFRKSVEDNPDLLYYDVYDRNMKRVGARYKKYYIIEKWFEMGYWVRGDSLEITKEEKVSNAVLIDEVKISPKKIMSVLKFNLFIELCSELQKILSDSYHDTERDKLFGLFYDHIVKYKKVFGDYDVLKMIGLLSNLEFDGLLAYSKYLCVDDLSGVRQLKKAALPLDSVSDRSHDALKGAAPRRGRKPTARAKADQVRALSAAGKSTRAIAGELGISVGSVHSMLKTTQP